MKLFLFFVLMSAFSLAAEERIITRALTRNIPLSDALEQQMQDLGIDTEALCIQFVTLSTGARSLEFSDRVCPTKGLVPQKEVRFRLDLKRSESLRRYNVFLKSRKVGRLTWTFLEEDEEGRPIFDLLLDRLCTNEFYGSCRWIKFAVNNHLIGISELP